MFSFDYLVDRPARVEPAGARGVGRPIVPEDGDGSWEGGVRGGVVYERDGGGDFEGRGSFDERDARDASEERDTAGQWVDSKVREVSDDYDPRGRFGPRERGMSEDNDDRERETNDDYDYRDLVDARERAMAEDDNSRDRIDVVAPTPLELTEYGDYYRSVFAVSSKTAPQFLTLCVRVFQLRRWPGRKLRLRVRSFDPSWHTPSHCNLPNLDLKLLRSLTFVRIAPRQFVTSLIPCHPDQLRLSGGTISVDRR